MEIKEGDTEEGIAEQGMDGVEGGTTGWIHGRTGGHASGGRGGKEGGSNGGKS